MPAKPSPDDILEQALGIDDLQARAAFLQNACQGDANLQREVESLLAAHFAADAFMNTIAEPLWTEEPVAKEGDCIGRYKLLQQIGEGGFGTVYLAEQTEPVRRQVALKVIKAGMDSKEVVARFEAERQALALMDHPNIAKVHDAGTTEGGRPYFVMELVKGEPITKFCADRDLDTKARLALFMDVCSAVQHAHQKGILHRDLKPSNILVCPNDGEPVVKVIDFGIAKAISMELTEKTFFTQLGQIVGTPQYMSPEQAELNVFDVDTRSDIYSLGVVLYEMLTGSTPLDGERLRSAAYGEMQRLIREETPPKPSVRVSAIAPRDGSPSSRRVPPPRVLRRDLDWIVMKALEKERNRRYETVISLAKDLGRYLACEPVEAGPPGVGYKLRRFVLRNRGGVAASLAIVATMIAATVVSISFAIRAVQEADRANRAEELAQQRLQISEESRDRAIAASTFFSWALGAMMEELPTGELEARRRELEICRKLFGEGARETNIWHFAVAGVLMRAGRYEEAVPHLENVRQRMPHDYFFARRSRQHLEKALTELGREDELDDLRYELAEQFPDRRHLIRQAGIMVWEGRDEEYEALRKDRLALGGDSHNGRLACDLAKLSCLRPITDEAMQARVLELARLAVIIGEDHHYPEDHLSWFRMCVGMAEYRNGHFADAQTTLEALVPHDPNLGQTAALYRVMSMARQGNTDEARDLFLRTEEEMGDISYGTTRHHDLLVTIIAYREAGTMLDLPLKRMPY